MRLAVLGGSFNPPHLGHLALAAQVRQDLGYDLVLLIPACRNPLKARREDCSDEDRMAMLQAAVASCAEIGIDDCELRRGGISYTWETIAELEERYRPEGKIGLILGDDLVREFPSWHRASDLAERCDLILANRSVARAPRFKYRHRQLKNRVLELSSSEIRECIAKGREWTWMVGPGVASCIEARALYGSKPQDELDSLIRRLEQEARASLSPARYQHTRGVALFAVLLCRRFGLDARKGYLAGIAHDICKEMPVARIRELALQDGRGLAPFESEKPGLLHARAAAVYLADRFGFRDADVLEAVAKHTYGSLGMGSLAKALYIADKIEFSRRDVDPLLRRLAWTEGLDSLFAKVLVDTSKYLRSVGRVIADETEEALKALGGKDLI